VKRVLVVDDDPVSRELIRDALGSLSYEVIEASNGEDALLKMVAARPDLILLDIEMPLLDGYGVLQRLRNDPILSHLPVAAISAQALPSDREKGLARGFAAYLTKPIGVAVLRTQVKHLLSRSASRP
jgi:two-component system, cell cycle response regulator DivK